MISTKRADGDRDQTFSVDNFKRIWDEEARRGRRVQSFIPNLEQITAKVKAIQAEHKKAIVLALKNAEDLDDLESTYATRRLELRDQRSEAIRAGLESFSKLVADRISSNDYSLGIREVGIRNSKRAYKVDLESGDMFFLVKQIERNLVAAFSLSMTNRHRMVTQLNLLLRDKSPKTVLKADVSAFFESVPHDQLISLLASTASLSRTSLRFVVKLLLDFQDLSGSDRGLPRGIGISSFLAEAYMQSIDAEVSQAPGVTYYSRYVDDIVVLSSHKAHHQAIDVVKPLLASRLKQIGLKLNSSKTRVYTSNDPANFRFLKLLGYEFKLNLRLGEVTLDMSKRRFERYKDRLALAFSHHALLHARPAGADTALVSRIRLLTGNHRVPRSNGNTMMGVSFSNRALTEVSPRLLKLDELLQKHIDAAGLSENVLRRISGCSFSDGFSEVRFERFQRGRIAQLGVIWKYAPQVP